MVLSEVKNLLVDYLSNGRIGCIQRLRVLLLSLEDLDEVLVSKVPVEDDLLDGQSKILAKLLIDFGQELSVQVVQLISQVALKLVEIKSGHFSLGRSINVVVKVFTAIGVDLSLNKV